MNPDLYILAFKDEALIKVGHSNDIYARASKFGRGRFDLQSSCLIQSDSKCQIIELERKLKKSFSEYRQIAINPLPEGNTETFKSEAFPLMIQFIESAPERYQINRDISSIQRKVRTEPIKRRQRWSTQDWIVPDRLYPPPQSWTIGPSFFSDKQGVLNIVSMSSDIRAKWEESISNLPPLWQTFFAVIDPD